MWVSTNKIFGSLPLNVPRVYGPGMAPSCWNHCSSQSIPLRCPSDAQNFLSTENLYCLIEHDDAETFYENLFALQIYSVWYAGEIGLHAKWLFLGWPRHVGENYCFNISCAKSTCITWKRIKNKIDTLCSDIWVLFFGTPFTSQL